MKRVKDLAMGAAAALSLAGVSSASAANWDPQNTNVTMTQEGASTIVFSGGAALTCVSGDTVVRATGAALTTVTTPNPLTLVNCHSPILGPVTVTTFGQVRFTATSTTSVDATWTSATGTVSTLHFPNLACDITVPSPVSIPNNAWNNTNHTLAFNSTVSIPMVTTGVFCNTLGTSLTLNANFVASALTIT